MRVCVFGAGAIGGLVAARLALAGEEVVVVARGAHLAAITARGLVLRDETGERTAPVTATDDPSAVGPVDYVIVTLKAPALPAAAPGIAKLLGPETAVVPALNGFPYWYFHGLTGAFGGARVERVDPGGVVSRSLPPERVIGCVVYPAAEVIEPGVVEHRYGDRVTLGEPDGSRSPRALALSEALHRAGFKSPVRPRIRDDVWVKLWGNLAFNPVSLLTHAPLDRIAGEAGTRALCRGMMLEGQAIGEALGARFAIGVDQRIDGAGAVVGHKTSMLQDLEKGRPVELDALLGAVVELADLTGVGAPLCRAVLALAEQRARVAGCHP